MSINGASVSDEYEINPDDLEPAIEIDLSTQKKVLRLLERAKAQDHYSLLGLSPTAGKRDISNAYFALMNELHTDKFYGKNIGTFGRHLSRLIEILTKANDVLGRKRTRAEYDEYLSSRANTLGARTSVLPRSPSSNPGGAPQSGESAEEEPGRAGRKAVAPIDVFPQIPKAPRAPKIDDTESDDTISVDVDFSLDSTDKQDRAGASAEASANSTPTPTRGTDAARRMLARKMGRRTPAAPASSSVRPPAPDRNAIRSAVDADLKARYDARMGRSPAKAEKYAAMADVATANRDWSSAVNSLRMAIKAMPDNPELVKKLDLAQLTADRELAPKFIEQGKYEEKDHRPERAARSFERAARGLNSAELYHRAATCLLKATEIADTDQRKGVELARQAVALDNRNAAYRLTLARAYDKAGMKTSAQGETRRALELEPNNDEAKQLHKDLK